MKDRKELSKAIESYLKSGGKITKIEKEDLEKQEIKLIGHFNPKRSRWKGGASFKTFY